MVIAPDLQQSMSMPTTSESRSGPAVWGLGAGDFGQSASPTRTRTLAKYSVVRQILAGRRVHPHQHPLPPPYSGIPSPLFYDVFTGVTSSITPR
jgi:hypothetical protein